MTDIKLRQIKKIWKTSMIKVQLCMRCVSVDMEYRHTSGFCDRCEKYSENLFEVRLKNNKKLWEAVDKLAKILKW